MLISILGLSFYGIRTGLDLLSILIAIMFVVNPFISVLINIIFKGETDLKDKEISQLKEKLEHDRDISEYKLQLVALKASADWNKYNELLKDIDMIDKKKE